MKAVAQMIRNHREGIVEWARSRLTNGFFEALNRRLSTIRTMIFLLAGKLDFRTINPHVV